MPPYDTSHFVPPAPLAHVTLRHVHTGATVPDVRLLIDTGADITLLPRTAVTRLGVSPLTDARLTALKTEVLYVVSDRAKALSKRAEHGLECRSMPDFFHCMHDVVKSSSLAIGRRLQDAHTQLKAAEHTLASHLKRPHAAQTSAQAQVAVEARRAEGQQWEEIHHTYRQHLETLSLTLPPFAIADSAPQTSAQVHSQ